MLKKGAHKKWWHRKMGYKEEKVRNVGLSWIGAVNIGIVLCSDWGGASLISCD